MFKKIGLLTIGLSFFVSLLALYFGPLALVGVWIGSLLGLWGLYSIYRMVQGLSASETTAKKQGIKGYIFRYIVYGLVLGIAGYMGVPILAMLVGVVVHKASIVLYSSLAKEKFDE